MPQQAEAGEYECGKGHVFVERNHPAFYSRSSAGADQWRNVVRRAVERNGSRNVDEPGTPSPADTDGKWQERNYLQLRRGPYVIAAGLDESTNDSPLQLDGHYVDLLDPELTVRSTVTVPPGEQVWLLDLQRVSDQNPLLLAAAGRVEAWEVDGRQLQYQISTPEGIRVSTRIRLDQAPSAVRVDDAPCEDVEWDETSRTVLVRHPGHPQPVAVHLQW